MQATATGGARLIIGTPDGKTRSFVLESDKYDLGRSDTNPLCFPAAQGVSRKHATFERRGSSWAVRDLGSTNGTFVNGARVSEPRVLSSNDRVTVGELNILFSNDPPPPPRRAADHTVIFVQKPASAELSTLETTLDGVLSTDRELQSSPHMQALVQAGRELCGHKSLEELFDVIMNLSMDAAGAARGVLITVEDGEFRVRASRGAGFRISSHVCDLVVNRRRSLLVRDALTDEDLASHKSIVQEQIRGILAVPLQTDQNVIGLIYLDSPLTIKEFTRDDLNVLTVLANIAAIRIEQARLAEIEQAQKLRAKELEHAALIQRSMLPADSAAFPDRGDFELHASMVPAKEVGGDLFDYFLLDEDHLGFVVGDVSGKGVPAGLFMAVTRTLLRATAHNQKGPGECFTYMNNTLAEGNSSGMFVTIFYGVLNTHTGDLEFANAGHLLPYLFSAPGKVRKLPDKGGPMLGLFEGRQYTTMKTRIAPGEAILLYTDGVTEAVNESGAFFEEERLERYLADHAAGQVRTLVPDLQATVKEFAKGMPQADDITVLALRYLGALQ
jgi:serine phosphatase RsbU (regulator of sigma subunit)/pSer/pThr/pTyr-binding forkhead associated (FHA) protein